MQILINRLEYFKSLGLTRTLQELPNSIDLCSNDYLGFAKEPILRQNFIKRLQAVDTGATGSRLLRGHSSIYEETEYLLAHYVNRESALLFSSGYSANLGLLSAILNAQDIVFSDEYNHASIIDGIQLSKAQKVIFAHRDYSLLEHWLIQHQKHKGLKVVVTESVFSMSGTKADLKKLADLAQRYSALLIVDEAHSTGLWGESLVNSLGLTKQVFATIHPAGKALGASGAWVSGDAFLKEYLIHFARSFIFSTASIPAVPLLLQETLRLYEDIGEKRAKTVRKRAQFLRELLDLNAESHEKDSPILFITLGDNQRALEISQQLQKQLWDVRAIRPPTVKQGAAGLRITVKWCNDERMLERFAHDLNGVRDTA